LLNFSTAMGVDLQTAASLVGKTLGSSTNALARYGIEVDATADTTEKLAQITAALDAKFAGAAETAAKTGLGPLTQLKNSAGDLGEEFGKLLIPELNKLVGVLRGVIDTINSLDQGQKEAIIRVAAFAAALGPLALGIGAVTRAAVAAKAAIAFLTGPGALGALVAGGPIIAGIIATVALVVALAEAVRRANVQQANMNKALGGQLELEETLIQLKIAQADVSNKLLRLEELRRQQGRQGVAQAIANAELEIEKARDNVRQLVAVANGKRTNIALEEKYGPIMDALSL